MSFMTALIILATTAVTSFISGIFGMAGGLILMGVLVALTPVATAMIVHGAIMMAANGWRAFLLRGDISWPVFRRYLVGAVAGLVALFLFGQLVNWLPDKAAVFLALGLAPLAIWVPKSWLDLDVNRRWHAEIAGFITQGMNTMAGVAGPVLDIFFVQTNMTRQQIVATKSATQVVSHIVKIAFWVGPLVAAAGGAVWPPAWLIPAAIPILMSGTALGSLVLRRMSDVGFRAWTKGIVTVIGGIYLLRAIGGG